MVVALTMLALLAAPAAAGAAQFGAYPGDDPTEPERSVPERAAAFERTVGSEIDVVNVYHAFSDTYLVPASSSAQPTDEMRLQDAGHTVMLSWRAHDGCATPRAEREARAAELAAGVHDATLRRMGDQLRALSERGPVLVRFHWEMDQDPGDCQYIGSAEDFRAAWRRVHTIVAGRAPAVRWVWAPRANSFTKGEGQTFWPGAAYVDLIGGSAVPLARSGKAGAWRGPEEIFGSVVAEARARDLPLLLWVAVREKVYDADLDPATVEWEDDPTWKADFIDDLADLADGAWADVLDTVVWYDSVSPKGYDFRVDTSSRSLAAIRRLVCRDVFGGCSPDTFVDDDGSVHEADIEWIAARGITRGCNPPTNDRYCPDRPVTRAQMASFLVRALDLPAAQERFVDVGSDDVHARSIGALAAAGITRGCNPPTNDRYCPDQSVSRAQMASFLRRALS